MATRFKEKTQHTYEDYMKTADDVRYELIDGELLMSPSPNPRHQIISGNINALIRSYVAENKLGTVFYAPCDVVFGDENVFEPDILFISNQNSGIITEDNIQGAPDLVIEVLSPSTAHIDLINKKRIYAKYGVKEYWIADPQEKTVDLFILIDKQFDLKKRYAQDDIIESVILDGLQIPIKEVF